MENLKNVKMPPGGTAAAGTLVRVLLLGGAAVVGAANSLFNVEGGHRAIVFNRLTGIKDMVHSETLHHACTRAIFVVYTVTLKLQIPMHFAMSAGVRRRDAPHDTVVRESHYLRCTRSSKCNSEHIRVPRFANGNPPLPLLLRYPVSMVCEMGAPKLVLLL